MINAIDRISLALNDTSSRITVNAKRGDTKREIIASITDNGSPYMLEPGCGAAFTAVKPDGNLIFNKCRINEDNTISYKLTPQTVNVVGVVDCEFKIYEKDFASFEEAQQLEEKVTTPRFRLLVEKSVFAEEDIPESSPEFDSIFEIVQTTVIGIVGKLGTDKTLTVDNYPADAKTVGDRLSELSGTVSGMTDTVAQAVNSAANAASAAAQAVSAAEQATKDASAAAASAQTAAASAKTAEEKAKDALQRSGDTMTGKLSMGGNPIADLQDPVEKTDAATKSYVDAMAGSRQIYMEVSLPAASWVEAEGVFTQSVSDSRILYTDRPHYGVLYSGTREQMLLQQEAFELVDDLETRNGSVVFTCFREKPETDLLLQLEISRTGAGGGSGGGSGDVVIPDLEQAIAIALARAKESGEFDGVGIRSVAIKEVT